MVKEFLSASSLATYGQPLSSTSPPATPTEMRHVIDVCVYICVMCVVERF